MFSDMASNQRNQLDLFLETKPNYPKQQVLMQLMIEVNTKIGKKTLKRCSEGLKSIENERKPV